MDTNMSYCKQCGKPLPDNAMFCPNCGTQVNEDSPNNGLTDRIRQNVSWDEGEEQFIGHTTTTSPSFAETQRRAAEEQRRIEEEVRRKREEELQRRREEELRRRQEAEEAQHRQEEEERQQRIREAEEIQHQRQLRMYISLLERDYTNSNDYERQQLLSYARQFHRIPEGTKRIGAKALSRLGENNIGFNFIIPSSVTEIAQYAFAKNNMYKIALPSTLEKVADNAFNACPNLESIYVESSNAKRFREMLNETTRKKIKVRVSNGKYVAAMMLIPVIGFLMSMVLGECFIGVDDLNASKETDSFYSLLITSIIIMIIPIALSVYIANHIAHKWDKTAPLTEDFEVVY